MLWLIVFMGCLCLTTLALSAALHRPFEQTVGGVLLTATLAAYLLALADLLAAAVWLLPVCAAAGAFFLVWHMLRTRRIPWELLTPGFWIFCLLCAVCWWNVRGRLFVSWDEFSHWGTVLKDMYYTGRLYSLEGACAFPDYPPAMPLMEYLVVRMSPVFREDLALYSMGMFSVSLLVYPLGAIQAPRLRRWLFTAIGGVALFFVPTVFFAEHYSAIAVDGIMGILLSFACFVCLFEKDARLKGPLAGAALALLALTKGAGFPFALMGCAVVFFALGVFSAPTEGRCTKAAFLRLQPLFITLLAQFGWSLHRTLLDIGSKWESDEPVLAGLKDLLFSGEPDWRVKVVQKYFDELLTNNAYGLLKLPYLGMLVLMAFFVVFAVCTQPRGSRRTTAWCSLGMLGAAIVYAVSLLYSYLFLFSQVEALALASVSRYLGTPATALLLTVTAVLLVSAAGKEHPPLSAGIGFGLLFLLMILPAAINTCGELAQAPTRAAQTQHDRYLCQESAAVIRTVSDGSDVYIISSRDNGAAIGILGYELAPVPLQEHNSGIACLYPEKWYQGYNVYCSPEEWSDILYNGPFRYVYLYQADSYFHLGYRELFEDETYLTGGSLLEVIRHEDGTVTLRGLILGSRP